MLLALLVKERRQEVARFRILDETPSAPPTLASSSPFPSAAGTAPLLLSRSSSDFLFLLDAAGGFAFFPLSSLRSCKTVDGNSGQRVIKVNHSLSREIYTCVASVCLTSRPSKRVVKDLGILLLEQNTTEQNLKE